MDTNTVVEELIITDNSSDDLQDNVVDSISVSQTTVNETFMPYGLYFSEVFNVSTTVINQGPLPLRVINYQFDLDNYVTNQGVGVTPATRTIEVIATYRGSGNTGLPTRMDLVASGNFDTLDFGATPPSAKFSAVFAQDNTGGQTNGFVTDSVGPVYSIGSDANWAVAGETNLAPSYNNQVSGLNPELYFTPSAGIYSLHLATRVTLNVGESFGTQAQLTYVIPEPLSMATWVLLSGCGIFAGRLRSRRPKIDLLG